MLLSLLLLGFLLWPCSSGFVQVDAKRLRLKLPDWLLSSECAIERPVQRSLTLGSSNSQRRTHARSSSLVMNNVGRWAAFGSLMELVLRPPGGRRRRVTTSRGRRYILGAHTQTYETRRERETGTSRSEDIHGGFYEDHTRRWIHTGIQGG